MSGDVRTLDDSALERIASGEGTMRDDRTLVREFAAEVLRLRGRLYATGRARDAAADAYDVLVRRVWEAATGDTHEGPASVDVLLEAVAGLRARAEKAEAERDIFFRDAMEAVELRVKLTTLRAAVRTFNAAYEAACGATTRAAGRKDLEAAWNAAGAARSRLRALTHGED